METSPPGNPRLSCRLWAAALVVILAAPACSTSGSFSALPRRPADPLLAPHIKARVLIFVSDDCPLCNRYSPEIRRLHKRYAPQGIAFWLVHSDPQERPQDILQHDHQYGLTVATLLDPRQNLAHLTRTEIVPSAVVFDLNGKLIYHGRIDDRFSELGYDRQQPSRHDLEEVLNETLANQPIVVRITKAVGCYIPNGG